MHRWFSLFLGGFGNTPIGAWAWVVAGVAGGAMAGHPALWGLAGALVYAAQQLGVTLLGETAAQRRVVVRAWLQFVTCIFFGAVAAAAFGPLIAERLGLHVHPEAVFLVVGLFANAAWPAIERLALPFILRTLGRQFESWANDIGDRRP